MKCICVIIEMFRIGAEQKLHVRASLAQSLIILSLALGLTVNSVADQPIGGISVDQQMWARVEELAKTDRDVRQSFERSDGKISGSILRRGGGFFAAYADEKGDIVTRRFVAGDWNSPLSVTQDAPRRDGERWDMPRLIQGPDDAVWLAYHSQIRRRIFFHRWLGDMWGPRIDGRGIHHVNPTATGEFDEDLLPITDVLIEGSRIHDAIEMRLTGTDSKWTEPLTHRPRVTRIESIGMVHMQAAPGESVIFIDARDVAQTKGLVWKPHLPGKNPNNPLLSPRSNPDSPDATRLFNRGTVLRENGLFRMWYSAVGANTPVNPGGPERDWQHYMRVCYAESEDGIHWQRPDLGLVEFKGSRDNNIVPGLLRCPTVYFDALEPDPDQRYKFFGFAVLTVKRKEGHRSTSPDGLRWRSEPAPRSYPGVRPRWLPEIQSVFRDERETNPDWRWKAYGLFSTGPTRRSVHLTTSPDGINWTFHPENPTIDPLQGVGHCIHDFIVWPESGRYVGLLQVGGENHNYGFELVVSRDGFHFSRVADGVKFIGRGEKGAWDHGGIIASAPVRVGDEWWFYYGGREKPWKSYPYTLEEVWTSRMDCGLATIGVGRYAGFVTSSPTRPGQLITRPITCHFDRELMLSINAMAASGEQVRVAVLDAETRQALPGFSLEECLPVVSDGVSIPVRWRNHQRVALNKSQAVRLQFELHGTQSKVFGFAWNQPEGNKREQ
jgi:hypothetical protein